MLKQNTIDNPIRALTISAPIAPPDPSVDCEIAKTVHEQLKASGYAELGRLACEYHEGMLVLRGTVSSYYMKQLAQQIASRSPRINLVVNATEVSSHPLGSLAPQS